MTQLLQYLRMREKADDKAQQMLSDMLASALETMSTKQLAVRLGMPYATLKNWVSCHRRPPAWLAMWAVDKLSVVGYISARGDRRFANLKSQDED